MLIPFLTFVGVIALVMGLYWVVVLRQEQAEASGVKRRLRAGKRLALVVTESVYSEEKKLSEIASLDALLKRSTKLALGLESLVDRSGLKVRAGTLLLSSAIVGLLTFLVCGLLKAGPLVGAVLGVATAAAPFLFVSYKAGKRTERFEELFPEALGLIVRALRAGHAFTTGLGMAADEMDDPVGPEFKLLYDQQNFGMPFEDAMRDFGNRIPLLDVKFFVTAVLTQRQAGGNLAEVLENLIGVVRDRFKVKRQIRVVTAHARITGTVLMLLPVICALVMLVIAPAHMRVLWTDPIGIRALAGGVTLQLVGMVLVRKIIRIQY
jgi:tight adherence protein B